MNETIGLKALARRVRARARSERRVIGYLGVDAGLMMFGDPCYVIGRALGKMDWPRFLDAFVRDPEAGGDRVYVIGGRPDQPVARSQGQAGIAILTNTGWGDGEYPVTAVIKDGRVMKVEISFK